MSKKEKKHKYFVQEEAKKKDISCPRKEGITLGLGWMASYLPIIINVNKSIH